MDRLEKLRGFEEIRGYARRPLGQVIHKALRGTILRGEIPPGERLVEERLAKTLGASRTPVREALQRLEQESLVEKLPYGGYEVRKITLRDVEEIFGIRSILESYAAALATRRNRPDVVEELEAIIAESAAVLAEGNVEAFIELNTAFHDRLYRASESERLYQMIHDLRDHFYRYRRVILLVEGMPRTALQDHERMIEAMRRGDEKTVEEIVRDHIQRGMKMVLGEITGGRLSV